MRNTVALVGLCLLLGAVAACQGFPRAEVFGGYSYLNVDTNGLSSRQSLNGWEAAVSGNFNRWFAAEADVSGYYKTLLGVSVSDYSYLAGPRINFKPIFVHALIGGDHLRGAASGSSASQDGLAAAAGGGLEWGFSPHLAARISADYVLSRHNILGGPSVTQNNVRASVGLVYTFGTVAAATRQARSVPAKVSRSGMPITSLGIQASTRESGGAAILEVASGSVAELAGLRVGDVINSVDGKVVRTAVELTSELSNRVPGSKIKVGYIRGYWQSETTVALR